MNRRTWIIVLLAGGVAIAVVIGLLGNRGDDSQANAQGTFCSSLSSLESSVSNLTGLSPTSASKDDYESAVSDVESDWDDVKSAASDVVEADQSTLDSAWDDFKSAVDDVPDDASVSDALGAISQAASSLLSTTKATLTGPDCSSA